ncbi:MAG: ABC transporter permease [Ignavibacteriae bacterium]|nr:ABC transporter permease [Ignavibacteriota bacterium]
MKFLSFISSIAILGVMLGTAALIITLSILDGFEREIKEKVVGFTSHVQVQGFQNLPLPYDQRSIDRVTREIPDVMSISPYAAREGMIRAGEAVDGIFLKGIDPSQNVSIPQRYLVEGTFLSGEQQGINQIILGKKLANRLNVTIGHKLVVFALPRGKNQSLTPRAMQFQLVGIYESGMAEYDDIYAYTHLRSAQKLFQVGEDVLGYDILVKDIMNVDAVAKRVQELLGYPHYARTVFQQYRNLFSWVELQKKLSPLLLGLIIIVATVNIIGTLLMFVLEKTEAIGILKSLGATPKFIQNIFMLQGLVIGFAGIILGNGLAFLFCWVQQQFTVISIPSDIYYMSAVPIVLRAENFVIVTLAAFLLCLITSILPSRAAAKVDPVTALRFG